MGCVGQTSFVKRLQRAKEEGTRYCLSDSLSFISSSFQTKCCTTVVPSRVGVVVVTHVSVTVVS